MHWEECSALRVPGVKHHMPVGDRTSSQAHPRDPKNKIEVLTGTQEGLPAGLGDGSRKKGWGRAAPDADAEEEAMLVAESTRMRGSRRRQVLATSGGPSLSLVAPRPGLLNSL